MKNYLNTIAVMTMIIKANSDKDINSSSNLFSYFSYHLQIDFKGNMEGYIERFHKY